MGEFAAGLEKQWELQNCCFYPPRGTSPKGIQGPTAKYEQHWWPGKCRVNNIITTKERNIVISYQYLILYQPKHPCRAGRLSKIFFFWVSLRVRLRVCNDKENSAWESSKHSSEVALLSQKSVLLHWSAGKDFSLIFSLAPLDGDYLIHPALRALKIHVFSCDL